MINERHETIDDIVKEIRGNAEHNHALVEVSKYLTEIADRIEASANRQFREVAKMIPHEEVDVAEMQQPLQPVADCHGLGNSAAMRKALESVRNWCINRLVNAPYQVTVEGLLSFVNIALSAHPRNLDVGTEEEKFKRFDRWCNSRVFKNCLGLDCRKCLIAWSQMPYEEVNK